MSACQSASTRLQTDHCNRSQHVTEQSSWNVACAAVVVTARRCGSLRWFMINPHVRNVRCPRILWSTQRSLSQNAVELCSTPLALRPSSNTTTTAVVWKKNVRHGGIFTFMVPFHLLRCSGGPLSLSGEASEAEVGSIYIFQEPQPYGVRNGGSVYASEGLSDSVVVIVPPYLETLEPAQNGLRARELVRRM